MAVYKVPQDVEAEDKLIGPFSFRQFIYLIVAAMGIFIGWFLSKIFIGLFLIPAPVVIFFLILALPLKKDQPMETYLTAVVRFFMKPRRRLWEPEGTIQMITITAPHVADEPELKQFTGQQAAAQLDYLARVVDTGGWASRGAVNSMSSVSDIVYAESQSAPDVFDETNTVSHNIGQIISQADQMHRDEMMAMMRNPTLGNNPGSSGMMLPSVQGATAVSASDDDVSTPLHFNPYPSSMHQKVLSPHPEEAPKKTPHPHGHREQPPEPVPADQFMPPAGAGQPMQISPQNQAQAPSEMRVSPDIIRLANDNNLSISSIAKEAHRLEEEHRDDDESQEVVIRLH